MFICVKFIVLLFSQAEDGGAGPPDGEKSFNCETTTLFLSLARHLSSLPSEDLHVMVKSSILYSYPPENPMIEMCVHLQTVNTHGYLLTFLKSWISTLFSAISSSIILFKLNWHLNLLTGKCIKITLLSQNSFFYIALILYSIIYYIAFQYYFFKNAFERNCIINHVKGTNLVTQMLSGGLLITEWPPPASSMRQI